MNNKKEWKKKKENKNNELKEIIIELDDNIKDKYRNEII